jgi:hypothetical protein
MMKGCKTFGYNTDRKLRCDAIMIKPNQVPKATNPKYGFNDYVERLNGRAAMVGLTLAVAIEVLTGEGVLSWLGFR